MNFDTECVVLGVEKLNGNLLNTIEFLRKKCSMKDELNLL